MANLNKVLLIGRLTRDPELRHTPSGTAVAEFGLAVNRFWRGQDGTRQEETAFVEITAWGRQAEMVNQYLNKGRQVFVDGHLKFDQWTSPEGQKRSKLTVVADQVQFLDNKADGGAGGPGGSGGGREGAGASQGAPRQAAPPAGPSYGGDDFGHGGGGGYSDGPTPEGDIPF